MYVRMYIERTGEGHILAFLTGQDEIEKACNMLRRAVEDDRIKGVQHQVRSGGHDTNV